MRWLACLIACTQTHSYYWMWTWTLASTTGSQLWMKMCVCVCPAADATCSTARSKLWHQVVTKSRNVWRVLYIHFYMHVPAPKNPSHTMLSCPITRKIHIYTPSAMHLESTTPVHTVFCFVFCFFILIYSFPSMCIKSGLLIFNQTPCIKSIHCMLFIRVHGIFVIWQFYVNANKHKINIFNCMREVQYKFHMHTHAEGNTRIAQSQTSQTYIRIKIVYSFCSIRPFYSVPWVLKCFSHDKPYYGRLLYGSDTPLNQNYILHAHSQFR